MENHNQQGMHGVARAGIRVILLTNPPFRPVEMLQEIFYQMDVSEIMDSESKLLQSLNKKIMNNVAE